MKIFLDGVEYKSYRKIMEDLGVRYGCINYEYLWLRTPRFSVPEATESFKEVMAFPGELYGRAINDYEDWLNANSEYISFALAPPLWEVPLETDVKVLYCNRGEEYYIHYDLVMKPFARIKYKTAAENGDIIHGLEFEAPYLSSMNTNLWMKGRAGLCSEFRNDKMNLQIHNSRAYTTSVARRYIDEGYNINLLKIKKDDWQEVSKVNCISWMKYQEVVWEKN